MQVGRRVARDADVVDVFDRDPRSLQAIAHGFRGETRAMLHAIEALFLNRRDDSPVFELTPRQRRRDMH